MEGVFAVFADPHSILLSRPPPPPLSFSLPSCDSSSLGQGTCLGHELILALGAAEDGPTLLSNPFNSENLSLPLIPTPAAATSRLYGSAPANVMAILEGKTGQNVTFNMHQQGVEPSSFAATPSLIANFRVLSTNVDRDGKPFVTNAEGINWPI
jgi:hypothetical protein